MNMLYRRWPLTTFFVLAYGISWMLWAPLWLSALGITGLPSVRFQHALGAFGPIAAAFLASLAETGRDGPRDLWQRLRSVRGQFTWITVALCAPYLLLILALVVGSVLDGHPVAWVGFGTSSEFPEFSALGFLLYNVVSFGIGEEVGWRGFALPRLQSRYSALTASMVLTVGWAFWHLPLFLYRPGYTGMSVAAIAGWLFSLLTGAILLTWLYNSSRGSLIVVALFHATIDVVFTSPASTPMVMNIVGALVTLWGIGVIVVTGRAFLSRQGKVVRGADGGAITAFVPRHVPPAPDTA